MRIELNYHDIQKEIKHASKCIRQANKGLPWKVKINKDFRLVKLDGQNWLTLQIFYVDGNLKSQVYNIVLCSSYQPV
jgi:hypothetical protein